MATKEELLAEAYRRGLLKGEKKTAYEEAARRGIVPSSAQKPKTFVDEVTGFMANVNRGLGVGDEMVAGANTLADLVTGKAPGGAIASFKRNLSTQRSLEDNYSAARPNTAAIARGTGNALTVAVSGPAALQAVGGGGLIGSTMRGAVTAALPAYASGLADRGDLQERVTGANISAALGGVLGGVGGALASRGPRAPKITPEQRQVQIEETLRQQGIAPEAMQDNVSAIGNLAAQNADPQALAMAAAARDLPVPVPMTTGQLSRSPEQQLAENLALRGADGPVASTLMRGHQAAQQEALRGNIVAIADQIAGGAAPPRGMSGELASGALNQRYDTAKAGVDAAYNAARQIGDGTTLPREQVPLLSGHIREALRDVDMLNPRVQSVQRAISRLDQTGGSTQVRDLFDVRAQLSLLRGDSDTMQAMAAGRSVRALDSYIDDALTQDLFSGDPAAVAVWRNAISQRREFSKLFEGDDLIENLTARAGRSGERSLKVDPRDASNYIFGRSEMGFVGKRNLGRDLSRLREVLGPESSEWGAIRAEAFQRLAFKGEGATDGGTRMFSGTNFQREWQNLQARDPALVRTLFDADEISRINQFATVSARATSPVKGGDNSSNTAVAAKKLIMNIKWLKSVPFLREAADMAEQSAATSATRRAISGQLPASVPRRSPGQGLRVGTAGAIGVGAASTQQSK